MKRSRLKPGKPPQRKTRIRAARSKPRPGRLKGEAKTQLRQACYERDRGLCQNCGVLTIYESTGLNDRAYEMAHIRNRRMFGDTLENTRVLCQKCHHDSHNAGGKPVPRKEA